MSVTRRELLIGPLAAGALGAGTGTTSAHENPICGLIDRMTARPGQPDALAAVLLEGLKEMPGCLIYIVAADPADADAPWITEVCDTKESHDASLTLPSVPAAIGKGRPMVTGVGPSTVTSPIAGPGLAE